MTGIPQTTRLLICDAYHRNPNWPAGGPYLIRCRRPAHFQLILQAVDDVYTVQRCQPCRDRLTVEAANGALFDILDESEARRQ